MTALTRLAAALVAALVLPGAHARQPHVATPPSYDEALRAARPDDPCKMHKHWLSRCDGVPGESKLLDLGNAAHREDLADWLESVDVGKKKAKQLRAPGVLLDIEQVDNSDDYALADLDETTDERRRWLIVARLTPDPSNSKVDDFYGVGPISGRDLGQRFFLIVSDYAPPARTTGALSYPTARWRVLGIERVKDTATGKTVKRAEFVGKSGQFHLCAHQHEKKDRKAGIAFTYCWDPPKDDSLARVSPAYREALGGRSLIEHLSLGTERSDVRGSGGVQTAALARAAWADHVTRQLAVLDRPRIPQGVRDSARAIGLRMLEAPAWIPCGIGCCTADQ